MPTNPMILDYLMKQGYFDQDPTGERNAMISQLSKASAGAGSIGGKMSESIEMKDLPQDSGSKVKEYLMKKLTEKPQQVEWRESTKPTPTNKRIYYNPLTLEEREGMPVRPDQPPSSQTPMAVEEGLRKEFGGLPEVKNFKVIEDNYKVISSITPSAAGDMSMIFSYMKMLDPGSTVREGEFANAQNAAGVPEQVMNLYNRLMTGERLNDNQRADFKNQAAKLYESRRQIYEQSAGQYKDLTKKYGGDPSRVIMDRQNLVAPQEQIKTMPDGSKYKKVQGGWQRIP